MQKGGVYAAHELQVHGHFPKPGHFFIVPVVALAADFGAEEDILDLLDPGFLG